MTVEVIGPMLLENHNRHIARSMSQEDGMSKQANDGISQSCEGAEKVIH